MTSFVRTDGGRMAAGFRGQASDCVARAVAIASKLPYADVYNHLADGNASERRKGKRGSRSARNGISTNKKWFKDYMESLGFSWVPTMSIGSGCKVHVRADELPSGRLVLMLSKHAAAFIDGVLYDDHDSSRNGTRCVYGYWIR